MFLVHGQFQFSFFDLWYEITWNMLVLNIRSMTTNFQGLASPEVKRGLAHSRISIASVSFMFRDIPSFKFQNLFSQHGGRFRGIIPIVFPNPSNNAVLCRSPFSKSRLLAERPHHIQISSLSLFLFSSLVY